MAEVWDPYVAGYHDANPGITEDVLAGARDPAGRSPYDWLVEAVPAGASTVEAVLAGASTVEAVPAGASTVEAVPAGASTVVDLACGSGPLARLLGVARRVVGVDQSAGELARAPGVRLQASAPALPLAGGCAGTVVCSMALMLLPPLEPVLAEVARVLTPGGAFVATLPVRSTGSPLFAAVLRDLGQVGVGYPEPIEDGVAARFAASGLRLESDETAVFTRPVRDAEDAATVVRGFYAPGAGPERVAAAVATLRRAVPANLGYRIRRLVARR